MPKALLVPVDGSSFAEHALPHALGEAHREGATLHLVLVHVLGEETSPGYPYAEAVAARDAEQRDMDAAYMEALVERLRPAGVDLRVALLRGKVCDELARHVREEGVELVVMTTHGRGGLQRAWLGSIADCLIRRVAIPVLMIRPSDRTREVDLAGHRGFRRVLAALDGSEAAETALRDALSLGATADAEVVLSHIVQPPVGVTSPYMPHTIQLTQEEMAVRKASMTRYFQDLAAEPWMAGRTVRPVVKVEYDPAPAILRMAAAVDADLIVMGTHGRAGLRRVILGSVADEVIRGTDRPVLVHRGTGEALRRTDRHLHGHAVPR